MPTPLIGRARELDAIRASVAGAAGGSPAAIVLAGQPGVGKTRLARAGLEIAADAGFATYSARPTAMAAEAAFAPLVAALSPVLRHLDPVMLDELAGDLPALGLLFSGLGISAPAPLGDPGLERARLFDAFTRLVERLAEQRPIALLIDDAHALDESTAACLAYLVTVLNNRPIALLLTVRPGPEARVVDGLADALHGSAWTLDRIDLGAMSAADSAALIEQVVGAAVAPGVATSLTERCAGRPLFLEAMARTLVEEGMLGSTGGLLPGAAAELPLPDVVRDQLRIRLRGLDTDQRETLDVLAVAGRPTSFALLTEVLGLPTERMVAALDALHGRGLLGNGTATHPYELAHDLLRATLLADLSPAGAAHLHSRMAIAMVAAGSGDPAVVEHVLGAAGMVDSEVALGLLQQGVEHARSLGATVDVIRYLTGCVDAATRLARSDLVASLNRDLGAALRHSGDLDGAVAAWTAALVHYRQASDRDAVADVEESLGMLAWSTGELVRARAHFTAAESALVGSPASEAQTQLWFSRVITGSRVGDMETVAEATGHLEELCAALHSVTSRARLLLAQAVQSYGATDYVTMTQTNRRALAMAEEAGDQLLVLRAYDQLSVALASQLDLPGLRSTSEASIRVAGALGAPVLAGWPRCRLAVADLLGGDWDAALRGTTEMCELTRRFGERRGSVSGSAVHALVLMHRGRLEDARRHLQQAEAAAGPMLAADRNVFTMVAIARATLALIEDDPATAQAHAARLEEMSGGWLPMLGIALLGEARARAGDGEGAETVAERLVAVRSCGTSAHRALAHWVRGLAAAAIQRPRTGGPAKDTAREHFETAGALFGDLGLPFHAARAQLEEARLGCAEAAAGDTGSAVAGRAALETFDQLGAPIHAQDARQVLRGLGVTPVAPAARGKGRGGLTARELEVARLVAQGLTNAEVATRLFLSPRTVTTHLDHIYTKLELSSRVALTRYLGDSGLLEDAGP